ncbi:MAG: hypothetical protein ABI867_04535 [Kofleriaceae bacterium]
MREHAHWQAFARVTAGATNLAFTPGETQVAGISVINGGVTVLDSMTLP